MKKIINIAIALMCLSPLYTLAQENNKPAKMSVMDQFLGMDCPQGDKLEKAVNTALIKNADEAVEYFITLIEKGPPAEWIENEQKDAAQLYEIRSSFDANKDRKITFEGKSFDQEAPKLTEQKEYVSNRVNAYILRLTARSMEGLSMINDPQGIKYLSEKADDKKFPLRALAEELLKENH